MSDPVLRMSISNPGELCHGYTASHQFDQCGGTIGSRGAGWLLNDKQLSIQPIHLEVCWREMSFCLIAHGAGAHLNGSTQPLGRHRAVRLKEGDCIRIGAYRLELQFLAGAQQQQRPLREHSLAEVLGRRFRLLDQLLSEAPPAVDSTPVPPEVNPTFLALACSLDRAANRCPLTAMNAPPQPARKLP